MKPWFFHLALAIIAVAAPLTVATAAELRGTVVTFRPFGIRVELLDAQGRLQQATETDETASFSFEDVPPGSYILRFSGPFIRPAASAIIRVGTEESPGLVYRLRPTTATLVAMAHAHALSEPDEFAHAVMEFSDWFKADDDFFVCAETLSARLLAGALALPSPEENYDSAMRVGSAVGAPPEIIQRTADSLSKTQSDDYTLARHLRELSAGVRGLLEGDEQAFAATDIYNHSKMLWGLCDMFKSMESDPFSAAMTGEMCQWSKRIMQHFTFEYTHALAASVCRK